MGQQVLPAGAAAIKLSVTGNTRARLAAAFLGAIVSVQDGSADLTVTVSQMKGEVG